VGFNTTYDIQHTIYDIHTHIRTHKHTTYLYCRVEVECFTSLARGDTCAEGGCGGWCGGGRGEGRGGALDERRGREGGREDNIQHTTCNIHRQAP
jgi:hypothetical protein